MSEHQARRAIREAHAAGRLGDLLREALGEGEAVKVLVDVQLGIGAHGSDTRLSEIMGGKVPVTLERHGVLTVGDAVSRSAPELLVMKGVGQTSVNKLRSALSKLGLDLRP